MKLIFCFISILLIVQGNTIECELGFIEKCIQSNFAPLCQCVNNEKGINMRIDNRNNHLTAPIETALSRKGKTVEDLNNCIKNRVLAAGPGTRYGVVQAGFGLIYCMNKMVGKGMFYDHTGGRTDVSDRDYCGFNKDICGKLGINTRWGKEGGSGSKIEPQRYGLNCASFVRWSLCNGGMDLCKGGSNGAESMSSQKFLPGIKLFWIKGGKLERDKNSSEDVINGRNINELLKSMKPGDIVYSNNRSGTNASHIMLVVGIDDIGIWLADNGDKVQRRAFNEFLVRDKIYKFGILDDYYNNNSNKNNLY